MSQSDGQSDRLLDNQSAKLTNKTTILCMSAADLERATKLSSFDVSVLLKAVALSLPCPPMRTALSLYRDSQGHRLSLGCQILDGFLRGGILSEGITEITGVSSSGKTQVCLQLCLSVQLPHEQGGLEGGAVYISTEDVFPSKRLHQLIQSFTKSQAVHLVSCKWNLSYNVFIEHAADVDDLQNIITHRLPLLLHRRAIKLVIIDSITALFRVEYSLGEMSKRAKVLRCFGAQLHKLSHLYSFPVVCVNQVSDVIQTEGNSLRSGNKTVIPALGLAWSSMVTTRLMLSRTEQLIQCNNSERNPVIKRQLQVIFAPHLPSTSCFYYIDAEGVHGYKEEWC
ncbi:DNA repair protein XRCC3-like isoform X2 [Stylophora pistillata]|uniref:DNA repair protein XRCC3-like isoform X2 n=1 Tax=Stylophora pistillata TaxID=50429 RepID=UPI000C04F49B|nr:DNA repair protein XRCC3-like isoform X2 [Stylophora pistillata]